MTVEEVTVQELKKIQDENQPVHLVDVRQKYEKDLVDIGGDLIPLGQLSSRMEELEPYKEKPIIVYCRSGARSAEACRTLMASGFTNVKNLKGGILKWAEEIDPSLPTY
ncbi:rhodanese-like domain-containing protein [Balneolales bacterium ANBcel1]|nr:rhodanese-like domain-containing protein [Balneolales bacterium ANBcel1]